MVKLEVERMWHEALTKVRFFEDSGQLMTPSGSSNRVSMLFALFLAPTYKSICKCILIRMEKLSAKSGAQLVFIRIPIM